MLQLPNQVKIVEVGPRDGLQNEKTFVPTETKIEFINLLSQTGLTVIEATSFVSPHWIPQLSDGAEVMQKISRTENIQYPVLIPNVKGLENALTHQVTSIAVFTAASETFNQKNINCSIKESMERIHEIIKNAKPKNLSIRGYISCCLGCPYEGDIAPSQVASIAAELIKMGCYEISLGDTIGVGTPRKTQKLIETVVRQVPLKKIAGHFHDTYGQALANVYASLECGLSTFDSSISGLGGCPYAKGATGNVATEDLWYLFNGLEITTGLHIDKLLIASQFIDEKLNRQTTSKAAHALRISSH